MKVKYYQLILVFIVLPALINIMAFAGNILVLRQIKELNIDMSLNCLNIFPSWYILVLKYIVPFIVAGVLLHLYMKPIRENLYRYGITYVNIDLMLKKRHLNMAFMVGVLISIAWGVSFIGSAFEQMFNYSYSEPIMRLVVLFVTFIKYFLMSGMAFVLSYYLMDYFNKNYFIPKLFPDGKISNIKTINLSVGAKFMIYYFAITIYPLFFIGNTVVFILNYRLDGVYASVITWCIIFFMVLGVILTYFVSRGYQKPLLEMKKAADEIKKGNYDIEIKVVSNDEVGKLGEAMKSMASTIKEFTQKNTEMSESLLILNRNLEEKVEERSKELKAAQEQIMVAEKLVAIGNFAGGIAHELNSPLGGVLTSAQMIRFDLEDLNSENIEEMKQSLTESIFIIEEGVKKSREIISRLLKNANIAYGTNSERIAKVDIGKVASTVLANCESQFEFSKYKIRTTDETERYIRISGNEDEISQVVYAVIKNSFEALKSVSDEREKRIKVQSIYNDEVAIIKIEDNGIGMTEEAKLKMFDPFFTTKGVGNTGLGLTVAYDTIKKHGAYIEVESKEGEGTKIHLEFRRI